jgi:hypothetical protein
MHLRWTALLPSDTHRNPITSITVVLLPFVTYLLTLPCISWSVNDIIFAQTNWWLLCMCSSVSNCYKHNTSRVFTLFMTNCLHVSSLGVQLFSFSNGSSIYNSRYVTKHLERDRILVKCMLLCCKGVQMSRSTDVAKCLVRFYTFLFKQLACIFIASEVILLLYLLYWCVHFEHLYCTLLRNIGNCTWPVRCLSGWVKESFPLVSRQIIFVVLQQNKLCNTMEIYQNNLLDEST